MSCSRPPREGSVPERDVVLFEMHAQRSGAPCILVCMPETRQTAEVWRGLSDELGSDFELVALRTEGAQSSATIARGIQRYRPAGHRAHEQPDGGRLPTLAGELAAARVSTCGDRDELVPGGYPAASAGSDRHQLRGSADHGRYQFAQADRHAHRSHRRHSSTGASAASSSDKPLWPTVSRPWWCAKQVSQNPNASEIKRALRRVKQRCDAIWVLNDDRLLSPRLTGRRLAAGRERAPLGADPRRSRFTGLAPPVIRHICGTARPHGPRGPSGEPDAGHRRQRLVAGPGSGGRAATLDDHDHRSGASSRALRAPTERAFPGRQRAGALIG